MEEGVSITNINNSFCPIYKKSFKIIADNNKALKFVKALNNISKHIKYAKLYDDYNASDDCYHINYCNNDENSNKHKKINIYSIFS